VPRPGAAVPSLPSRDLFSERQARPGAISFDFDRCKPLQVTLRNC
jgi:hypothetical protein